MFKWLNKQDVEEIDKGFIVQSMGRFTHEYREKSRILTVETIDIGKHPETGQFIRNVKSDNFEKWDDGTPIDTKKQEEIKRNFIEALKFQNILVDINDDTTEYYRPGG